MDLVDKTERDGVIHQALEVAKEYTDVDDSHRAGLRTLRKEQIINLLVLACLSVTNVTAGFQEDIERQRRAIKQTQALLARRGRAAPSKGVGDIVSRHAMRLWKRKPWLRQTAHGTATEIAEQINADLRKGDLKKLGAKQGLSVSAIAKRVKRIQQKSA